MSAGEKSQAAELRAAYIAGHALGFAHGDDAVQRSECACRVEAKREAARLYPDPAEPRVVRDSTGMEWRYLPDDTTAGGAFQARIDGAWIDAWWEAGDPWPASIRVNADRVRLWADLMAYPFERDGQKRETAG